MHQPIEAGLDLYTQGGIMVMRRRFGPIHPRLAVRMRQLIAWRTRTAQYECLARGRGQTIEYSRRLRGHRVIVLSRAAIASLYTASPGG
jgi:hypothetical protein